MKYLTIDTTTKITALSLAENGQLVGEIFLHTGKNHSERLIPLIDQLMNAADWKLQELNFIGVVRGPGSFTGIRIGIATAQGLAQVLNIPLVGIISLDTLAWAGRGRSEETVVILDARKNEWYYARYQWKENKECLDGPRAVMPEDLTAELKILGENYFFVGDAVPGARTYMEQALGKKAILPPEYQYFPRGAYAACEAWEQWNRNEDFSAGRFDGVEPVYIRLSEAEVNYQKRHPEKQ